MKTWRTRKAKVDPASPDRMTSIYPGPVGGQAAISTAVQISHVTRRPEDLSECELWPARFALPPVWSPTPGSQVFRKGRTGRRRSRSRVSKAARPRRTAMASSISVAGECTRKTVGRLDDHLSLGGKRQAGPDAPPTPADRPTVASGEHEGADELLWCSQSGCDRRRKRKRPNSDRPKLPTRPSLPMAASPPRASAFASLAQAHMLIEREHRTSSSVIASHRSAASLRPIIKVLDQRVLIFDPPESNPVQQAQKQILARLGSGGRKVKDMRFCFDRVFDEFASQEEVYEGAAKDLVGGVLDGYNATAFAYGATGCGKTHTITGTDEAPGIVYLLMRDLFARVEDKRDEMTVEISSRPPLSSLPDNRLNRFGSLVPRNLQRDHPGPVVSLFGPAEPARGQCVRFGARVDLFGPYLRDRRRPDDQRRQRPPNRTRDRSKRCLFPLARRLVRQRPPETPDRRAL